MLEFKGINSPECHQLAFHQCMCPAEKTHRQQRRWHRHLHNGRSQEFKP